MVMYLVVSQAIMDHIEVVSAPFTSSMAPWQLQWETVHWWMIAEATPLFLAAAFAHPKVVEWLLMYGADRSSKCYLGKTAIDFVGECCETSVLELPHTKDAIDQCRALLQQPPRLPSPPPNTSIHIESHASSQVVLVKNQRPGNEREGSKPDGAIQTTHQTIHKCLLRIGWSTALSNGSIIEKYEIRYRMLITEENESLGLSQDQSTSAPTSSSWRVERCNHNRRRLDQEVLIQDVQFDTTYEFGIRSWNAAGKGEWGRSHKFRTMSPPDVVIE